MENFNKSYINNKLKDDEEYSLNLKKIKKNKIYNYFYILRIISAYAVILIHLSDYYKAKIKINSNDWKISYFYNGISRFAVPIFFMISGSLFLSRDISFKNIFNKYIKSIFIHLIIWSFIYSIYNINISKIDYKKFLFRFIRSHFHLWYLFETIKLYMIVPFLREISKKEELLKMFLILSFIFTFLIPIIIILLSHYSILASNLLDIIYEKINLNYITGYVFHFMLGYFLNCKLELNKKLNFFFYIFGLLCIYFNIKFYYYIAIKKNEENNYMKFINLNIIIYSASIFIFFKNFFNHNNNQISYFIKLISNNTFGVYLIHLLIMYKIKLDKINIFFSSLKLIFRIPLINLFIFILSLLISIIIKHIPIIGNYIF